jgi:hypothetical protein
MYGVCTSSGAETLEILLLHGELDDITVEYKK